MIKVSALMFAAAAKFVSTEETRYYINGVHVEPCHLGGALMVATDGHRLFCIRDENGECTKPAIVKLDDVMLRECAPTVTRYERDDDDDIIAAHQYIVTTRVLTVTDDGTAELVGVMRWLENCHIDGKFPAWRKLLDGVDVSKPSANSYNGKYLGTFGDAAALLNDDNNGGTCIAHNNNRQGPALILFPSVPNAFGLIMPLNVEAVPLTIPEFAFEPKKVAAE